MSAPILFALYAHLLIVLPVAFRAAWGDQLRITARDLLSDPRQNRPRTWFLLFRDLLSSALREHLRTFRSSPMPRPLAILSAITLVLAGLFGAGSAVYSHTLLRRSANQPQQQMAERYAAQISAGTDPAQVLPSTRVNLASDLDPFFIFVDPSGRALAGNGFLDDTQPVPPAGVLQQVRDNGSDTLTWRPRNGVRIAMVAIRTTGAHAGVLVVGRSLSTTEQYENSVYQLALWGHIVLLLTVIAAAALLVRGFRPIRPATA